MHHESQRILHQLAVLCILESTRNVAHLRVLHASDPHAKRPQSATCVGARLRRDMDATLYSSFVAHHGLQIGASCDRLRAGALRGCVGNARLVHGSPSSWAVLSPTMYSRLSLEQNYRFIDWLQDSVTGLVTFYRRQNPRNVLGHRFRVYYGIQHAGVCSVAILYDSMCFLLTLSALISTFHPDFRL